jgi:hypothetical protein
LTSSSLRLASRPPEHCPRRGTRRARPDCAGSRPGPTAGVEPAPCGRFHSALRRKKLFAPGSGAPCLHVNLAAVDPAVRVLSVDARLARLARVLEGGAGHAGFGEDVPELHRLGGDPRVSARLRSGAGGRDPCDRQTGDHRAGHPAYEARARCFNSDPQSSLEHVRALHLLFSGGRYCVGRRTPARPRRDEGEPADRLPFALATLVPSSRLPSWSWGQRLRIRPARTAR